MSDQKDDYFDTGLTVTWPGATRAAVDVLLERKRQIEVEGWTAKHDDSEHGPGQLALAGAAYAAHAASTLQPQWEKVYSWYAKAVWPWDRKWWKPKEARRDLVRAAALILAEIERLDRHG